MPRGPLPNPQRRRRNEPTIPTTTLPAEGRTGTAPKVPTTVTLGKNGKAWWAWAWKTPQACAWSDGDLMAIARRATLEDDLAAIEVVDGLDLVQLLELVDEESQKVARLIEFTMRRLHALAAGKITLVREMRELDDRLGLTPKAFAQLRWTIEAKDEGETAAPKTGAPEDEVAGARRRRLVADAQ